MRRSPTECFWRERSCTFPGLNFSLHCVPSGARFLVLSSLERTGLPGYLTHSLGPDVYLKVGSTCTRNPPLQELPFPINVFQPCFKRCFPPFPRIPRVRLSTHVGGPCVDGATFRVHFEICVPPCPSLWPPPRTPHSRLFASVRDTSRQQNTSIGSNSVETARTPCLYRFQRRLFFCATTPLPHRKWTA